MRLLLALVALSLIAGLAPAQEALPGTDMDQVLQLDRDLVDIDFPVPTTQPARPATQPAAGGPAIPAAATSPASPAAAAPTPLPAAARVVTPAAPAAPPAPAPVAAKKPAEPPLPAQKQAETLIHQIYASDYAKPAAADKQALAKRLLADAGTTADDPAARYVLLREARDLAAQTGDVETALAAVDHLDQFYAVDANALTLAALGAVARGAPSAATQRALAEAGLHLTQHALASDDYEFAGKLLAITEPAARAAGDPALLAAAAARAKEIAAVQRELPLFKAAQQTLAKSPDDPAANLAAGRFLCLLKGDWDQGLPLLAKAGDGPLKAAATLDLAGGSGGAGGASAGDAAKQVAAGDAWWDLAQADRGPAKPALQARAAYWYERALPALTGLSKARIEKRLVEDEPLPRAIDLLALLDLGKDATRGVWTLNNRVLTSPPAARGLLQVPYAPPAEYDLEFLAERTSGAEALYIGLVGGDHPVTVVLDAGKLHVCGLDRIDARPASTGVLGNETSRKLPVFTNGRVCRITCTVRKDRVTVVADGRVVVNWNADWSRVTPEPIYRLANPQALALGTGAATTFEITRISLKPISGKGKKLR